MLGGTVARLLVSTPNEVEQAAEATVGLPLTCDELKRRVDRIGAEVSENPLATCG
jgi:hypothetical protein